MSTVENLPIRRKIAVFYCESALRGKDLEKHIALYPDISFVKFPCTGRINPIVAFKAITDGIGAVIVYGCPVNDCHNFDGNMFAKRRFHAAATVSEALGVDPDRISYVQKDPLDYGVLTREISAARRKLDEMGAEA